VIELRLDEASRTAIEVLRQVVGLDVNAYVRDIGSRLFEFTKARAQAKYDVIVDRAGSVTANDLATEDQLVQIKVIRFERTESDFLFSLDSVVQGVYLGEYSAYRDDGEENVLVSIFVGTDFVFSQQQTLMEPTSSADSASFDWGEEYVDDEQQ
jgi:hypothetical protein